MSDIYICGREHSWDEIKCEDCNCDRKHSKMVICYNGIYK